MRKIYTFVLVAMLTMSVIMGCGNNASQTIENSTITSTEETQVETTENVTQETTVEETSVEETTENVTTSSVETSASSEVVKNVPVGNNPEITSGGEHKYTFTNSAWVEVTLDYDNYVAETVDEYGVTYIEHRKEANEYVMNKVAEFVEQNPDSNFAKMITQNGNVFVVVTSWRGLWDDTYDYSWNCGIVDCEPEDCLYLFIAGNGFDGDFGLETSVNDLFTYVSENFSYE